MDSMLFSELIPLITVLTPVFNSAHFLVETIESILAQSFTDYEFLLIDDGSTDDSLAIARQFEAIDPRIHVVSLEHAGVVAAMNAGIQLARGQWIARIDADDLAQPDRLERQLQVVRAHPHLAAVGSHSHIIGQSGKVVGRHTFGPTSIHEFEEVRNEEPIYLVHSSVMFSRAIALELGGYRQEAFPADDIDLWTRMADHHPIVVIPEPLVSYRIHASSISSTRFDAQMESARRIGVNMARRRSGLPELSAEEYAKFERQGSWIDRIRTKLGVRSQRLYRRGGGQLASGDVRGLLNLAGSFLLYPPLPVRRLKKQGVVTQARRSIRKPRQGRRWAAMTALSPPEPYRGAPGKVASGVVLPTPPALSGTRSPAAEVFPRVDCL